MYCEFFPLRTKFISTKRLERPWLTSGILKSIKIKSNYFKLHKTGLIDTVMYRNYRNLLTKLIRKSKNHYFRSLFDKNKNDIKYTWKIYNDLLGKRSNRKHLNISTF